MNLKKKLMYHIKQIICIAFIVFLSSCFKSVQRINDKEDIKEASKQVTEYLDHVKNGSIDSAYLMTADSFKIYVPFSEYQTFNNKINASLGNIISYKLSNSKSEVFLGNENTGRYFLVYEISYVKGKRNNFFYLVKTKTDKRPRIQTHNIE